MACTLRVPRLLLQLYPEPRDRGLRPRLVPVHELALPPAFEAPLWDYLERAAYAMVNTFEPRGIGPQQNGRPDTGLPLRSAD